MIVVTRAAHPQYEVIEHQCIDCPAVFRDNNRRSKRCPQCRAAHKRKYDRERKRAPSPR